MSMHMYVHISPARQQRSRTLFIDMANVHLVHLATQCWRCQVSIKYVAIKVPAMFGMHNSKKDPRSTTAPGVGVTTGDADESCAVVPSVAVAVGDAERAMPSPHSAMGCPPECALECPVCRCARSFFEHLGDCRRQMPRTCVDVEVPRGTSQRDLQMPPFNLI